MTWVEQTGLLRAIVDLPKPCRGQQQLELRLHSLVDGCASDRLCFLIATRHHLPPNSHPAVSKTRLCLKSMTLAQHPEPRLSSARLSVSALTSPSTARSV